MTSPFILVADWLLPEFDLESDRFGAAGCTWELPAWQPPAPPREVLRKQILKRIAAAPRIDAVLFQLAPLDTEVINTLPATCRIMQRVGIGLDNVDRERAAERGIEVRNVPDYCTEEVAVQAMAKLLSLHRQLGMTQQALMAGAWSDRPPRPVPRLSNLTLGIIGLGRIGGKLAEWMKPIIGRVVYADPHVSRSPLGIESLTFEELLDQSDLVSLHCPLLPETRHIIDREAIGKMKPTAILVNTARGGLVDAEALARALAQDRLGAAGLDVFEPEILPADSALRDLPNVILTSHTAWYSEQSTVDVRTKAIENILASIAPT